MRNKGFYQHLHNMALIYPISVTGTCLSGYTVMYHYVYYLTLFFFADAMSPLEKRKTVHILVNHGQSEPS